MVVEQLSKYKVKDRGDLQLTEMTLKVLVSHLHCLSLVTAIWPTSFPALCPFSFQIN